MSRNLDFPGFFPLCSIKVWVWVRGYQQWRSISLHVVWRELLCLITRTRKVHYGIYHPPLPTDPKYARVTFFSLLSLLIVPASLVPIPSLHGDSEESHQPVWKRSPHGNSAALWATSQWALPKSGPQWLGLAGHWGEWGGHRRSSPLQQREPAARTDSSLIFLISEVFPNGWSCLRVKIEK